MKVSATNPDTFRIKIRLSATASQGRFFIALFLLLLEIPKFKHIVKRLLLLSVLLPFFTFAQTECDSTLKESRDKFTDRVSFDSEPLEIKRDGKEVGAFVASYNPKSKYTALIFIVNGDGCVDDNAKITFLFDDNSKLDEYTFNKFNCDGSFSIVITDKNLKKGKTIVSAMSEKKLTAARFAFRKGYKDIDFTEDESSHFKQLATCLLKTAQKSDETTK